MTQLNDELINCGQRTIQTGGRISVKDIMTLHKLKDGDVIEIYIKLVRL